MNPERVRISLILMTMLSLPAGSQGPDVAPPPPKAQLIGEGVISTPDDELGGNLTPNPTCGMVRGRLPPFCPFQAGIAIPTRSYARMVKHSFSHRTAPFTA
jgi:hypothetical protein